MINQFRISALHIRLLILFAFLNVYDFVSTKWIVGITGSDGEANPLMRWVIEHYTIWGILVVKIVMIGIFALCISVAHPNSNLLKPATLTFVMLVLNALMLATCCWNTFVVYQVWVP